MRLETRITFDLGMNSKRVSAALGAVKFPTKTHFFTHPPTLEDGLIVVKRFPSIETVILLMK